MILIYSDNVSADYSYQSICVVGLLCSDPTLGSQSQAWCVFFVNHLFAFCDLCPRSYVTFLAEQHIAPFSFASIRLKSIS